MKLSTRYGLVGIAALSALSAVHWGRGLQYDATEVGVYLIGVVPNVAASIAIPFVLLGIWADHNRNAPYAAARRSFLTLTLAAGAALLAWEFMQLSSDNLVFDLHDIGATILGMAMGWLLFAMVTPPDRLKSS